MNLDLKRALIRATIIALLIVVLIGSYIVEAGTTAEKTPQETQAATETAEIPTDETEPTKETEATTTATEPPAPTITEPTTSTIVQDSTGEWRNLGTYKLTAYCSCQICCGEYALNRPTDKNGNPIVYTSTGAIAEAGTTIAVDPSIIPYGSKVKINGHTYTAQDCGGAIKGNRIDIYFDDHQDALQFGVQMADIFILRDAS